MVYPKKQRYIGKVAVSNTYIAVPSKTEVLLISTKPHVNGLYLVVVATGGGKEI